MPIYEYACARCGETVEVMQRVSDPPPAQCPSCGAPELTRQISRTTFQLKGGGWYADLYASTKRGGGSSGEAPKADGPKKKDG